MKVSFDTLARAAVITLFGTAAACNSNPPPVDSSIVDASDAAPAADVTDATPTEAGNCRDFSGAFRFVGVCFVQGLEVITAACVAQSGCDVTIATKNAGQLHGTVVGDTMTFDVTANGITQTCTTTLPDADTATVSCTTPDGTNACDASGTRVGFGGASSYCCDVHAPSCGEAQRCAIVAAPSAPNLSAANFTACIPNGTLAADATCTRTDDGTLGHDTCGAGLSCANVGHANPSERSCERLCTRAADCQANEVCYALSYAPHAGICAPACTLHGAECGAGLTCRTKAVFDDADPSLGFVALRPMCDSVGAGALGASCTGDLDCGADLECRTENGMATCHTTCDSGHPCVAPLVCGAWTGGTNATGAGSCLAAM